MDILHLIDSKPWLITAEWLAVVRAIAGRENLAVELREGQRMEYTRTVTYRDGVAVIPIDGPIFPKANLMTEFSGATSVEVLAKDIQVAVDNPEVHSIVLNINSPGGHVTGIHELSEHIRAFCKKKRIVAYVNGMAASAAYWIASSVKSGDIVVDKTAELGSIGVVAVYRDERLRDEAEGVVEHKIISSVSPNKQPDPASEEGRSQIQQTIDDLADVFVRTVARNRGVSMDTVLNKFGAGGTLVGAKAVKAGLADRLGSLESVISELNTNQTKPNQGANSMEFSQMKIALGLSEDADDAAVAEAVGNIVAANAQANSAVNDLQAQVTKQSKLLDKLTQQVAQHQLATPDAQAGDSEPPKAAINHVVPSLDVLAEHKTRIAQLEAKLAEQDKAAKAQELEALIENAQTNGLLVSASEVKWARDIGRKDLADLKNYIASVSPLRSFVATQTGGETYLDEATGLSGVQSMIAKQTGIGADAFSASAKQLRDRQPMNLGG